MHLKIIFFQYAIIVFLVLIGEIAGVILAALMKSDVSIFLLTKT